MPRLLVLYLKLVEGGTIQERLSSDAAGCRHAATVMVKVALAVHHAHQRGVLHRDLKPSNVLLDAEHEPHVIDFGLAHQAGDDTSLTLTQAVLGTVVFYETRARRAFRPVTATSTWVLGLSFSPDGRTLASAEGHGTIKLWNVATREVALTRRGHLGQVAFGNDAFSPDGTLLASTGADGTVRLWRAARVDEIPYGRKDRK